MVSYGDLDSYRKEHRWDSARGTVAVIYNANNYPSDCSSALSEVVRSVNEFANVIPIASDRYGYDDTTALRSLLGVTPDVIVGFMGFRFISGPMGGSSRAAMEFIQDMDAPFLRPCLLTRSTREEWMSRTSGFQVMEFMINGFMPELDGGTCIFPVAVNEETEEIPEWGIRLSEVRIIPDRLSRLLGKIRGLLELRYKPNGEKRIAIVGYNYPPGEDNLFGGSFLDTLGSLSPRFPHRGGLRRTAHKCRGAQGLVHRERAPERFPLGIRREQDDTLQGVRKTPRRHGREVGSPSGRRPRG